MLETRKGNKLIRSPWLSAIVVFLTHLLAFHALYLILMLQVRWQTLIFCIDSYGFSLSSACLVAIFLHCLSMIGVTAGAHRYWSHKSYKASQKLQWLLSVMHTMSFQFSIFSWVENHRLHHKYVDTDGDPHNVTRGLFFAHIGWLFVDEHPVLKEKRILMECKDLEADPVVAFQHKHFWILGPVVAFAMPTILPVYCWHETVYGAFATAGILRFIFGLHAIFLINSAAHTWGMRPYDKKIQPTENWLVSYATCGEGWHNYHHTFPWDYKAAELNIWYGNMATGFIDIMASIGWASNLRTVSREVIEKKIQANRE